MRCGTAETDRTELEEKGGEFANPTRE